MTFFEAALQGMVQGLAEFLPISSSGHLSILQYFAGLSSESAASFSIALHAGTLLSVFVAFFPTIWALIIEAFAMLRDIFTRKFTFAHMNPQRRMIVMLFVSIIPLAAVFFLKDFYSSFSSDNDIIVEGVCLILTGIMLRIATKCPTNGKKASSMKYGDAVAMGIAQAIAPMPGISRSGSTISVGMLMGLGKEYAVTFSFIMGIPAVLGATILEIPQVLAGADSIPLPLLLTGIVTSAVFGLLSIVLVKKLVVSDKFRWFSYYTIIFGAIIVLIGIYEIFSAHALQGIFMSA